MLASLLLAAAFVGGPAPRIVTPCAFGAENAISGSSTLADQLRCYQTSGRRVSIAGTSFTEGGISGGYCVKGVASDRVQVGRCSSFGSDAAITIPFTSIAFVTDNPDAEYVSITLVARGG